MSAHEINEHLATPGHVVQISTYGKATLYTHKHEGFFKTGSDGNIYVKRGKHWDCLTMAAGKTWLVALRFGRLA